MFDFFNNYFFGLGFGSCHNDIFKDYQIKRDWSGLTIFYTLLSIVMDILDFKLKDTMNERYLKLELISNGKAIISPIRDYKYDPEGDLLNLCITDENNQSTYGLPVNVGVTDYTGKAYDRLIPYKGDNEDYATGVVVYWNEENIPPLYRILRTANRLLELDCQISAAITNLKATVVVKCENEQKEVVKKAWNEADKGLPVILTFNGSSDFGAQPELLVNNLTGDILKQLMETYDKTLADFCAEFGLNTNAVINKLSGVSDKELEQNTNLAEVRQNAILKSIRKGLDDANKLFGADLSVDLNYNSQYTGSVENTEGEEDIPDAETENI